MRWECRSQVHDCTLIELSPSYIPHSGSLNDAVRLVARQGPGHVIRGICICMLFLTHHFCSNGRRSWLTPQWILWRGGGMASKYRLGLGGGFLLVTLLMGVFTGWSLRKTLLAAAASSVDTDVLYMDARLTLAHQQLEILRYPPYH